MNTGDKAVAMRAILETARNNHPDTAHEPRAVLYQAMKLPALSLAILYDAVKGGV